MLTLVNCLDTICGLEATRRRKESRNHGKTVKLKNQLKDEEEKISVNFLQKPSAVSHVPKNLLRWTNPHSITVTKPQKNPEKLIF